MNVSPLDEIIQASRELEGVAVDLGEDAGRSNEERFTRLRHLAALINGSQLAPNDLARAIETYNTILYVLESTLIHRQVLLEEQDRIADEYTLFSYLEFRAALRKNGPYTLERHIRRMAYVGYIEVLSWSWLGAMRLREIKVLKGSCPTKVKVKAAWRNPRELYPKGSQHVVLWHQWEGTVSGNNWPITPAKGGLQAASEIHPTLLPFEAREASGGRFSSEFRLDDFREWFARERLT